MYAVQLSSFNDVRVYKLYGADALPSEYVKSLRNPVVLRKHSAIGRDM